MYKAVIPFLISTILLACSNVPKGIIPIKPLGNLLIELQLADALAGVYNIAGDTSSSNNRNMDTLKLYSKSILQQHHITEQQFIASMQWYNKHPQQLDSLINYTERAFNLKQLKQQ
jgi:hypothetical protein